MTSDPKTELLSGPQTEGPIQESEPQQELRLNEASAFQHEQVPSDTTDDVHEQSAIRVGSLLENLDLSFHTGDEAAIITELLVQAFPECFQPQKIDGNSLNLLLSESLRQLFPLSGVKVSPVASQNLQEFVCNQYAAMLKPNNTRDLRIIFTARFQQISSGDGKGQKERFAKALQEVNTLAQHFVKVNPSIRTTISRVLRTVTASFRNTIRECNIDPDSIMPQSSIT